MASLSAVAKAKNPSATQVSACGRGSTLLVVLILATFLALARYGESPTKYRLVVAALAAGAAMLVKAVAAPMVLLVCVTYQLVTRGRRGLLSREWAWFVVIAGLPVALFYGDGLFVSGFLRGQAASNFIPHLLVEPAFWHNWTTIISVTIGWGLVLLAGIGTMLLPRPWRAVVAAMWAGYFVFGLTNDYRTATHTYYHLQLVPVVAIGVAGLISAGQRRLSRYPDWRLLRLGAAFTGVLALVLLVRAAFAITPAVPPAQRALPGIDQRIGSLTSTAPGSCPSRRTTAPSSPITVKSPPTSTRAPTTWRWPDSRANTRHRSGSSSIPGAAAGPSGWRSRTGTNGPATLRSDRTSQATTDLLHQVPTGRSTTSGLIDLSAKRAHIRLCDAGLAACFPRARRGRQAARESRKRPATSRSRALLRCSGTSSDLPDRIPCPAESAPVLLSLVPTTSSRSSELPKPWAPEWSRLRSVPSPWNVEKRCAPTRTNDKRLRWSERLSTL
jgi:hypothetical protein